MTHYNYDFIKIAAAAAGQRITDLIALAPQNDPFYAGTPTDVKNGLWFADIWRRARYTSQVHLRRVHYWIVSQNPAVLMPDGLPYENTEKCWKYLTQAAKMARYLGYVRIADIADNKNPAPKLNAWYWDDTPEYKIKVTDFDDPEIEVYGIHNGNIQPYHLEVWCEKSTMNDVLFPICNRYGANLATFEGEVSITACYRLLQRIQESKAKPTRIFYLSDFDPAGNSMPVATARKIEFLLSHFDKPYSVMLKPVVLTAAQVEQYRLPRIPIKDTEKRAAKFEEAFGSGAVELDALEALYPGTLSQIVEDEIEPYYSQDAEAEAKRQSDALRQSISEEVATITAKYKAQIEALQAMKEELDAIEINAAEYGVERFEPHVDEPGDWLFDSERDYIDQLPFYKAHKGQLVES